MATTWIIAADESRARVLQVLDREQRLAEIEDLVNPAGRAQDRELQTDAEPRFNGSQGGPASDLERQGAQRAPVRPLVLVAPPKFLGALRKELHKEVEKLVTDELPKDLSWFNAREIEKYFAKGSARAP